jgi:hypothetical protein
MCVNKRLVFSNVIPCGLVASHPIIYEEGKDTFLQHADTYLPNHTVLQTNKTSLDLVIYITE